MEKASPSGAEAAHLGFTLSHFIGMRSRRERATFERAKDKVRALAVGAAESVFVRVEFEMEAAQVFAAGVSPSAGLLLGIREEQEVIDITDVAFDAEILFHEVIEAIETDVGEELAGEVADGQAAWVVVEVEVGLFSQLPGAGGEFFRQLHRMSFPTGVEGGSRAAGELAVHGSAGGARRLETEQTCG